MNETYVLTACRCTVAQLNVKSMLADAWAQHPMAGAAAGLAAVSGGMVALVSAIAVAAVAPLALLLGL